MSRSASRMTTDVVCRRLPIQQSCPRLRVFNASPQLIRLRKLEAGIKEKNITSRLESEFPRERDGSSGQVALALILTIRATPKSYPLVPAATRTARSTPPRLGVAETASSSCSLVIKRI